MDPNGIDGYVLLGDLIDYGPHSNEVIELVRKLEKPVLCNIWGNHEEALMNEHYERFSSDRGKDSARFTRKTLTEESIYFLMNEMETSGRQVFFADGKKCLAVHGSLEDVYWKSILPYQDLEEYGEYDYVFSGHSHEPHFFEKYYVTDDAVHRNRKKTIFINPGSVGQPRNLNCMSQYAILDTQTEDIHMVKVSYDVEKEMQAFSGQVDVFYKKRLLTGV